MSSAIQILLVHDDVALESRVKALVDQQTTQFHLLGIESDYATAHRHMKQRFPDVILLGKRAGMVQFLQIVNSAMVTAQSLVVVGQNDDARALWQAGATGICTGDIEFNELATALVTVASGNAWLSKSVAPRVLGEREHGNNGNGNGRHAHYRPMSTEVVHGWQELSDREMSVLRLIANGARNREIAGELYTSISTIKSDIARILSKLGVDDRVEAAVYATRHGLV